MSDKWFITHHLSNINAIIKRPLQSSQRIKFTCFDVSSNFIVFGATSGSLYVFNRNPCTFIKIIPCKQGSATQISISPNEKNIAVASLKGSIILLQNCFMECDVQQQVFTEHIGNLITTCKWHLNELYCGDSKGKITLITIPNVLSKTILHPPCASLMQLDSSIVQIDCYSVYLLISTNSRTYICNTEKEQYRQIGKQLRDSPIGACIISNGVDVENATIYTKLTDGLFKNIKDDESFISTQLNENLKFYCGRPSARLWEAKLDGTVSHTHHVKSFLKNNQISLIHLDDKPESRLIISRKQNDFKNLTFTKVYRLENFIFTFNSEGFYIFNPETAAVISCCNHFKYIRDVKIVEDLIYIWNENEEISVVGVYDLEKIVIKTLLERKFVACGELCLKFLDDLLPLVEKSNKLHLVMILKEKLYESSSDLLEKLIPLFKALEEFSNKKFFEKPTSGIVAVNNIYHAINAGTEGSSRISPPNEEDVGSNEILVDEKAELNLKLKIFNQRFDLSKINNKVEMVKFDNLLISNSVDASLELFMEFNKFMVEKGQDEDFMQLWCFRYYLKYFLKCNFVEELEARSSEDPVVQFVYNAFCMLNNMEEYSCNCSYPLPTAKNHAPKFYDIGCELLKKFYITSNEHFEELHKKVPFMWKYIIIHLKCDHDIDSLLPLLIQFGDEDILLTFLTKFKYDTWDRAVQLIINLNKQKCINCDNNFQQNCDIVSWKKFAILMVQSMGAPNSLNLLTRYASFIPSQELDANFFQTCIFSSLIENSHAESRCESINLVQNLHSNKITAVKFEKLLGTFLQDKSTRKTSTCFINSMSLIHKSGLKCSFCELPISVPILGNEIQLNCKHFFHEICLQFNNNLCVNCK